MFVQANKRVGLLLTFIVLVQVHVHSCEVDVLNDDFEDSDVSNWLGQCPDCCPGVWDAATGDLVMQNTSDHNFMFLWGPDVSGDATFHTQVTWNGQPQGFGFIGITVYRAAGSCFLTPAYAARLKADGTLQIKLWHVEGYYENLAPEVSMPQPFDPSRDYHLELEVRGDELEFQVWPEGDKEEVTITRCTHGQYRSGTFSLQFNKGQGFSEGVFRFVRITQHGPCPFHRGDANADATLDIADAIFTLGYLFAEGPPPSCLDAADANDDGMIDIADAISVLSHLFAGRGDLPEPFGECGIDPTIDALGCSSFPPCQ